MQIHADTVFSSLPPEWQEDLFPTIQARVAAAGTKIVVLDDDPTGTQTVHNVTVLAEWTIPALAQAFAEPEALVYVLTNSRSLPLPQAQTINREIARNLRAARAVTGRDFVVVSRSDSTLRGHYPGETDALVSELGYAADNTLIIPFFLEGGRLTIADTHYVRNGSILIPVAETEYARDPTFGYRYSDLRAWVAEKYRGQIAAADVASITLEDLRLGGPAAAASKLRQMVAGQIGIVNAVSYRDLEVLVAGLLDAEAAGQRFLYRTAASFVRVRGGISPRALLTARELGSDGRVGLVVVGSHIQRTTQQLDRLRALPEVGSVELPVAQLLDEAQRTSIVRTIAARLDAYLAVGKHALVFTSREVVMGGAGRTVLQMGQLVSEALVAVVARLQRRPAWVVAKGGITSSDIATRALGVRRATVLGQAIPGVPVWRTGAESRWPGLTYVVFPGNVGEPDALVRVIDLLCERGA